MKTETKILGGAALLLFASLGHRFAWPKPQDPKPACVGDAKLAYTEGFDAAVGLARGMCGQISPNDKAGCMAKLHTLYQQDKPQP